jgi:thioester reductase-like protein|mmetsp:Transcript_5677/g.6960  ORF Transcript_5677/g.6960 Transcript_5677/m.6960 type:complete len:275 (-) Transcript_5677:1028-1852(-)
MSSSLQTNQEVLEESHRLQGQTKQALGRIQQQLEQTEELGEYTLEGMKDQTTQMDIILVEGEKTKAALQHTKKLQNTFDRWSLKFGGRKRREAKQEAQEIKLAMERDRQLRKLEKQQQQQQQRKQQTMNHTQDDFEHGNNVSMTSNTTFRTPLTNSTNATTDTSCPAPVRSKLVVKKKRNSPQEKERLDEECKASLAQLDHGDAEIDAIVDQTSASLDRLHVLSKSIQEESHVQSQKTNAIADTMDTVVHKQANVNARVKGALTGKWKRRNNMV